MFYVWMMSVCPMGDMRMTRLVFRALSVSVWQFEVETQAFVKYEILKTLLRQGFFDRSPAKLVHHCVGCAILPPVQVFWLKGFALSCRYFWCTVGGTLWRSLQTGVNVGQRALMIRTCIYLHFRNSGGQARPDTTNWPTYTLPQEVFQYRWGEYC